MLHRERKQSPRELSLSLSIIIAQKVSLSISRKKAYIVPIARSAAVEIVFAALVTIDHLPRMIDRFVGRSRLLLERFGHLAPGLLVDDGELLPAVVVEKRHN